MLSTLRVLSVAILLGLGVAVFQAWSSAIDSQAEQQYRTELNRLQVADTALTSEVLEVRSGMVNHYDDIVRRLVELRELAAWLSTPPRFVGAEGAEQIAAAAAAYDQTVATREAYVESFKFDHAVLRNSLRFFPGEAMAIAERISSLPDAQGLAASLSRLYSDVPLFYLFSERELKDTVSAELERVQRDLPPGLTEADRRSVALLAEHATVILTRKPLVDEAISGLVKVPSAERVRELQGVYVAHHARVADAAKHARGIAWFLALSFVLTSAAYFIVRLRGSARALARARDDLSAALASLEVEKDRHKELAELKSRFVSMTSHEFRTPLSVVLSSAELLQAYGEKWPEEKRKTHLGRVQQATQYMKQMLDEVLLIGRAEAGKLEATASTVDVVAFCDALLESLQLHAGAKNTFEFEAQGELGAVLLDEVLLTHILDNLLSNAVKYSEPDSTIYLAVERDQEEVVFRVTDEGIGISDEDQEQLFETFHRGKNVGTISGSGLGLAVVKRSLEVLGGSISVTSEVGVGSTFELRVPQLRANNGMRDVA